MSERHKLEQKFLDKHNRTVLMSDFIVAWGKLVENCKHERTHWIQEIDSEGEIKGDLMKRCYVCGTNIDELEVESEFVEKLLDDFDKVCDAKKLLVTPVKALG